MDNDPNEEDEGRAFLVALIVASALITFAILAGSCLNLLLYLPD